MEYSKKENRGDRRDFWNMDLNPITMMPAVKDNINDKVVLDFELKADYNFGIGR